MAFKNQIGQNVRLSVFFLHFFSRMKKAFLSINLNWAKVGKIWYSLCANAIPKVFCWKCLEVWLIWSQKRCTGWCWEHFFWIFRTLLSLNTNGRVKLCYGKLNWKCNEKDSIIGFSFDTKCSLSIAKQQYYIYRISMTFAIFCASTNTQTSNWIL